MPDAKSATASFNPLGRPALRPTDDHGETACHSDQRREIQHDLASGVWDEVLSSDSDAVENVEEIYEDGGHVAPRIIPGASGTRRVLADRSDLEVALEADYNGEQSSEPSENPDRGNAQTSVIGSFARRRGEPARTEAILRQGHGFRNAGDAMVARAQAKRA